MESQNLKTLSSLAIKVSKTTLNNSENGVLSGLSGVALFQISYAKLMDSQEYYDLGLEKLIKCVEEFGKSYHFNTFCSGLAGVGWTLSHLEEESLIDQTNSGLYEVIDKYLHELMVSESMKGNYDYLHGSLGHASYFLKRFRLTGKTEYKLILEEFLNLLRKISTKDEHGRRWTNFSRGSVIASQVNLSFSHGMASIVRFLTRTFEFKEFDDLSYSLLIESLSYINAFRNKDITASIHYPSIIQIDKDDSPRYQSRLAWCYGDLGIGLALLKASEVLSNQRLKELAMTTLINTTSRRNPNQTGVQDAMLCHGSFGLFEMYNHLFQTTNLKAFKESADYWFMEGEKFGVSNNESANFLMWNAEQNKWEDNITILNGLSGIGLSYISRLKNWTSWNECLMIN